MHDQHDRPDSPAIPRRSLILGAGALGAGGLFGSSAGARGTGATPEPTLDPETEALLQGGCVVTGSDVEGPFHLDLNLVRNDITEGYPGIALRMYLLIHDVATCSPIENAVVDVWHTEAQGTYSGFQSRGTAGLTFLRGIQFTPQSGLVWFDTVYPGWYTGRTPHVHVKVTTQGGSELTTQLYFPQSVNDRVFTLPPYNAHGPAPVTNATDAFFESDRVFKLRRDPNGNGIIGGKTIVIA